MQPSMRRYIWHTQHLRATFRSRWLLALVLAGALGGLLVPRRAYSQEAEWPDADPEDVASVDAIIAALYDVISGPAGEARHWDRFRSLHVPEARLIPTGADQETGQVGYQMFSVEEYIERAGQFLEQRGFFESEIGRVTEEFKSITHAFSTYQSSWTPEDPEPFQRGINSIQLFHDGDRWWIVNIFWRGVPGDEAIPDRYLGQSG
jgi:hypothetical protein